MGGNWVLNNLVCYICNVLVRFFLFVCVCFVNGWLYEIKRVEISFVVCENEIKDFLCNFYM